MNALLVISACICAAVGLPQYYPYSAGYAAQPYAAVAPYVAAPPAHLTYDYNVIPDTAEAPVAPGNYVLAPPVLPNEYKGMHHSQDELGQFAYGHTSLHQAHTAIRDYTGAVQGSYTYIDADGNEVVAHYIADEGGFRVSSNALPVAPVFEGEAPVAPEFNLEAPVFDLEAPVFDLEPAVETPEVAAAREEHFRLVEEHKAILAAALAAAVPEEPAAAAPEEPAELAAAPEEPAELAAAAPEEPAELAAVAPQEPAAIASEEPAAAAPEEPAAATPEEPAALAAAPEPAALAAAPEEPAEEEPVAEAPQEEVAAAERRRKRQVLAGGKVLIPEFYRALPAEPIVLKAESLVEGAVGTAALRDAEVLRIVHNPAYGVSYRVD